MGEYATALAKGDELPAAERKAVIDKLVRYTGLDAHYIDETNLRWDVAHFTRQLLRDRAPDHRPLRRAADGSVRR